jgi:hypothetical protein
MSEIIITVNGKPVTQYLNNQQPKLKLAPTSEQLLQRSVKPHIVTSRVRNHSGARTSRGRVIMSAGVML